MEKWAFMMARSMAWFLAFPRSFLRLCIAVARTQTLRLRQGIVVCSLALLTLMLAPTGMLSARAAQATADPQVLIAVDATSPSCIYIRFPSNHASSAGNSASHGRMSGTRMSCPAGTVMTFTTVPLSKAIAEHEPYVLPLAPHASVAQQEQWENQLQQLLLTKRRTLQANLAVRSLAPSTTASCGYSAGIYTGGVYYNEDLNMEIDYNVSSDCKSVYLSTVAVYAGYVPYNNPVWWPEFAYAAYKNVCTTYLPVEFVPYTNYSYHPNQWHTSGYYGIFTFENGTYPQCTFGGGGPWTNVAVGPVD